MPAQALGLRFLKRVPLSRFFMVFPQSVLQKLFVDKNSLLTFIFFVDFIRFRLSSIGMLRSSYLEKVRNPSLLPVSLGKLFLHVCHVDFLA